MLVVEKGPANVFGLLGVDKNGRNYHGTIVRAQSTCLQRGVVPGGYTLTSGCVCSTGCVGDKDSAGVPKSTPAARCKAQRSAEGKFSVG